MIKEYDLRDDLDQVARHISEFSSNPISWDTWILYFLKSLEKQAMDVNPSHQEYFEDLLSRLQDMIYQRRRTGGW